MASPQLENGYTQIANEILEALARINLTAYQSRVLMVIWRKTYGWKKKEDRISGSQIVEMTGLHKSHVSRTMKEFKDRRIVTNSGNKVAFNKNYSEWKGLHRKVTNSGNSLKVTNLGQKVTNLGNSNLLQGSTDKGLPTPKETNKRNIYCLNSDEFRLSELLLNLILERRNGFKRPDLQKWAKHIDLMVRIEEREPQELERIIKWCQSDPFWQNNILSTGKLRKQYDQLAMKMEECNASSKPKRFDEEDWQS